MARIRTVKPEFFHNRAMASCSPHARLLAIGLLQMADSEGRLENIPMQVHAHVFPWEAEVNTQVLLGELEAIGYLVQYQSDGRDLIQIVKFVQHQRLTGKESSVRSKYPEYKEEMKGASPGNKGETPRCFPEKHLDAQEQGTGNRDIQTTSGADAPTDDPKAKLWRDAVAVLGEKNRALVGREVKKHGPTEVAKAVAATALENPADPKAYFLACLPKSKHIVQELEL